MVRSGNEPYILYSTDILRGQLGDLTLHLLNGCDQPEKEDDYPYKDPAPTKPECIYFGRFFDLPIRVREEFVFFESIGILVGFFEFFFLFLRGLLGRNGS